MSKEDIAFYNECKLAKKTTYAVRTKKPRGLKAFSGRLTGFANRKPILFNQIVQSVYDRHMDIMYLYEIFIAQKNKCDMDNAVRIAKTKRHSRHEHLNPNSLKYQQEIYTLEDDNCYLDD